MLYSHDDDDQRPHDDDDHLLSIPVRKWHRTMCDLSMFGRSLDRNGLYLHTTEGAIPRDAGIFLRGGATWSIQVHLLHHNDHHHDADHGDTAVTLLK